MGSPRLALEFRISSHNVFIQNRSHSGREIARIKTNRRCCYFGYTSSRSHLPTSATLPSENRMGPRPTALEEDQPKTRPMSKPSRSFSSDDVVRPSGLPRLTGVSTSRRRPSAPPTPTTRLGLSQLSSNNAKAKTRDPVVPAMDGSRSINDRPRNVLRRKANFKREEPDDGTTIARPTVNTNVKDVSTTKAPPQAVVRPEHEPNPPVRDVARYQNTSTIATKLPRTNVVKSTENGQVQQIPKEFIGLRTVINTSNLPPPTPIFPSASSPSTRYSGSPGMWSSRGSTPTSLSSYSPGITQPTNYRFKQQSPVQLRQTAGLRMTTTPPVSQIDSEEPTMLGPIATDDYARSALAEIASAERTNEALAPTPIASFEQSQPSQTTQSNSVDEQQHDIPNPPASKNTLLASPNLGSNAPIRPRRPSRDGTDKLEQAVSPVIRSNLPGLRTNPGHTRRASADKVSSPELLRVIPVRSAATSVESLQSNASSRIPSRSDTTPQIPRKAPRTLVKVPKESKGSANATSPNKFSLFSKKSKAELTSSKPSTAEKTSRKGPTAGTGHEGYGKYAHRGRKPSISGNSNDVRARSTSSSDVTSISANKGYNRQEPGIDDFLRERLEPVIINGGGMDRDELFRTQSGQSLSTMSVTSASASSTVNGGPIAGGYSSESLISSIDQNKPAVRMFSSDTSLPSQLGNMKQMKPKITRNESAPAQIVSNKKRLPSTQEVSRSSEDSNFSALPQISKVVSKSESIGSTKISTTKPSRRWNFFHRSQRNEPKQKTPVSDKNTVVETQLPAQVATLPKTRPVAHYALLDADSDSLEEILHRVEESPPSDDEAFLKLHDETNSELSLTARHGTSVLLPSPPAIWKEFNAERASPPKNRPASPKVFFQKEDEGPEKEGKRRSRLAPVGRIPRVVSRRDRDHKPPAQSYSRPFSRDEAPSLTITAGAQANVPNVFGRSKLNIETDPLLQGPFYTVPNESGPFSAPAISESAKFMSGAYATNEFLQFSPQKQSEVSSSTSEGDSILATVAAMGKPNTGVDEEDIWAEYDDLLDTMLTPNKNTVSEPKKLGSFELAKKASKTLQAEISASDATPRVSTASDTPSLAIADATSPDRSSDASVRLRRSKIAAALHSSISPSPQVSYSELIAGYSERNKSLSDFIPPDSPAKPTEEDNQPQPEELRSPTPTNTPDFETTRRRNTMLFDMAERMREGAAAQTNLRSASLMTSKWLSFGRVLFSPAHNRVQKSESESILILDGLGNDDWSYYCALTYPNTNIYNMSIRSGSSSSSPHPDAWKPPANHHLVHHTGDRTAFPFSKGFFSACVLRFPAASSEDRQRHILSECKRVLRPGGYLEMSILDLDLVNVGSKTRKAVRKLKEKIYIADPDISLKPASDNIQRLLGICGYDNLNRCMVSIPVAGMIGGSTASSNSNNTLSDLPSAGTGLSSQPSLTTSSSQPHARTPSDETEPSLGDLLSDPSPSATNDESITKVVARVGRWWYTRCYEIPVLSDPTTDQSIWSERRLLRECQKRGTGFRLLIAYAQKPSEKRRTVSL
ncbi:conserved hypothetical protein [Talaromyces stipitatus ATCC 10500]|uniref:Uncharacterized protein n=1 Tax=Talaromyces stipitatus (strain ATCC 10500 / CBS 375.48 / QM 6759 / NRRL 1006) TaxID=441959 RepID=B8MFJ4_TALSN|nr:uncharacterized protein TSTA_020420 [Talaromyces stipitatus ATCC 10500]EED16984.1 conserved hypothetical protein [Talaromyces stipitatus ATCC 10500]